MGKTIFIINKFGKIVFVYYLYNKKFMNSIQFIMKYPVLVNHVSQMVKPEYKIVVEQLKMTDPHDLITPETYFVDDIHALGFVWNMFRMLKEKYFLNQPNEITFT